VDGLKDVRNGLYVGGCMNGLVGRWMERGRVDGLMDVRNGLYMGGCMNGWMSR
jgi:hypothetical protein